tara:strand:- start:5358 stop:6350 length:993 start_codon:yes stop_codon:yes gene_type:complete
MAVTFQKIWETSQSGDLPLAAAGTAQTNTYGINSGGGPVEFLILRGNVTFDADPVTSDIGNLLSNLRVVCNGDVLFDYRASTQAGDSTLASPFTYFNNKIGGRCYEVPSADPTTREWYWAIPIGRQLPQGVNRWEIVLGWGGSSVAGTEESTSGKLEWYLRNNDGMQVQTTVISPTSFTHSANAIEMVTVRIPQSINGVVSGILVQNSQPTDNLGTQGIRVQPLGPNGLEAQMWRWLNGDLENGIMYTNPTVSATQQDFAFQLPGQLLLPVFGLQGGDVILQVDTGAGDCTRTYTPIISQQINASPEKQPRQTEQVRGNAAAALLAPTKN